MIKDVLDKKRMCHDSDRSDRSSITRSAPTSERSQSVSQFVLMCRFISTEAATLPDSPSAAIIKGVCQTAVDRNIREVCVCVCVCVCGQRELGR